MEDIKYRVYIKSKNIIEEVTQINFTTKSVVTSKSNCYMLDDCIIFGYTRQKLIEEIERLQKENKELKNKTQIISPLYVKENYIPKDKIKAKYIEPLNKLIKEKQEEIKHCRSTIMENQELKKLKLEKLHLSIKKMDFTVQVLEELLEEE